MMRYFDRLYGPASPSVSGAARRTGPGHDVDTEGRDALAFHRQSKGLGFSVDYVDRFDAELPYVLERLSDWRDAGVDAWLDLDQLEREIRRAIHAGGGAVDRFQVQFTVLAAEYLFTWHEHGRGPAETRR